MISTISPDLIGKSIELKLTACASSSLSTIHLYFPSSFNSLFLTGPSTSTQFEKAAVFLVLLVVSLNAIWSILEVLPEVDTYLYLVLNWTTSWESSSPKVLGAGIGQNPLTLNLGDAEDISEESADALISETIDPNNLTSEDFSSTSALNSLNCLSLSTLDSNFLVFNRDFLTLIASLIFFKLWSAANLSDLSCLIFLVVVLSVKCLFIWITFRSSTDIVGESGVTPTAAVGI